ncbi:glycosyltransferase family 1 protein [Chaetomium sp. MPI-CAGE-AT-0009]|nr:glycosyltransferase family 1 protein [Chaetomium sp. MPI-CAGE-AT-0009]
MNPSPALKRVLLLTNSEHGQANVFLATSYALLTLEDEDVEVHFASFHPIKSFVSATSDHAQQDKPGARPIIFHTINGVDMVSAWTRPEIMAKQEALKNRNILPLVHAIRRTLMVLKVTLPWTGQEFVQIMHSVTGIVHDVQPDSIAVDPCFSPALTVLRHIKARFIVLSPNTIKDFALPVQPNAEALWKYPRYLEFPLRVVPPHVVPCGPMLRPARAVGEVDGELAGWLAGGSGVVYVNLGTHVIFDGERAAEMAGAVKMLKGREVEVEGKGKGVEGVFGPGGVVERVLGEEVRSGVVKVVDWLEAEPMAVLETGVVVCAVHHGGANSFLEAVCAGVPQVVLPVWMDTFDFARRAELLGIGRWGNRLSRKLCEEKELGAILTEVVAGEKASAYAQKAKELAAVCNESGGGKVIAARYILARIEGDQVQSPSEGENERDSLLATGA